MKRVLAAWVLGAAWVLSLPGQAQAGRQWLKDGVPAVQSNSDQVKPLAVPDGRDGVYLLWQDSRTFSFTGLDIYAVHLDSSGNRVAGWPSDGLSIVDASGEQGDMRAVPDGAGGFVVSWLDGRGGDADVYALRVSSAGDKLWASNGVIVSSGPSPGDQHGVGPVVAGDAVLFPYVDLGNVTTAYVQVLKLSDGSKALSSNGGFGVFLASASNVVNAAGVLSTGAANGAIVGFLSDYGGVGTLDLYAARVSTGGSLEWLVAVATGPGDQGGSNGELRMEADGTQGAYLVWADSRTLASETDVYASRVDSAGFRSAGSWVGNGTLVSNASGNQEEIVTAAAPEGIAIAWRDRGADAGDVYAHMLKPDGAQRWSGAVKISTPGASVIQRSPAVAASTESATRLLVSWRDSRSGFDDVYAQLLDASGTKLYKLDDLRVVADTAAHGQIEPTIAGLKDGFVVAWADSRDMGFLGYDVYAQRVSTFTQPQAYIREPAMLGAGFPYLAGLSSLAGAAEGYQAEAATVSVSVLRLSDTRYWDASASAFNSGARLASTAALSGSGALRRWDYLDGPFFSALQSGTSYLFELKARDFGGVEQAEATFQFVVPDTHTPTGSILTPTHGETRQSFPSIAGTAADAQSGISHVGVRISSAPGFNKYWNGSAWLSASDFSTAVGTAAWAFVLVPQSGDLVPSTVYKVEAEFVDYAGNSQSVTSTFTYTGDSTEGTYAVALDTSGFLWSVIAKTGQFGLYKFTEAGVQLSSSALPFGRGHSNWRIAFSSGYAYAVGTASGTSTRARDLAVYKADSAGVLVSSAGFNSPYNLNDYALGVDTDSLGRIWIAGGIQTVGPADEDLPGARQLASALWKYDGDVLTQTTAYFGNDGFEAAFDVEVDSADRLWVLGLSSSSANTGRAHVDVALAQYDASGASSLLGPYRRKGFLEDGLDSSAALALSTSGLYAASFKLNASGNGDFVLLKYDFSGSTQTEKYWHSASPAGDDFPLALALDASGGPVAVGASETFGQKMAVWRYDASPAFQSAKTVSGKSSAQDVVVSTGGAVWLATESTAPFKLQGESSLSGAEGEDSGSVVSFSGDFSSQGGASVDGDADDAPYAVDVDTRTGDVFVGGASSNTASGRADWLLVRYNASGVKTASTTFSGAVSKGDDSVDALFLNETHNELYVAGNVATSGGSGRDSVVRKYDPSFGLQASTTFASADPSDRAIAYDGSDVILAEGSGEPLSVKLYRLSRSDLSLISSATFNFSSVDVASRNVLGGGVGFGSSGEIYVSIVASEKSMASSTMGILKFNSSLVFVSSVIPPQSGITRQGGVAVHGSGDVFAAYTSGSSGVLAKFNANLLFLSSTVPTALPHVVRAGSDGNVYVGGNPEFTLERYDSDLNLFDAVQAYDADPSTITSLAVLYSSKVYAAAFSHNGFDLDWRTLRADLSGGAAGGSQTAGFALSIDTAGTLWQVFADASGGGLGKYSGSGVYVSSTPLPNLSNGGTWSVLFSSGFIYAVGTSSGTSTVGHDLALYKVRPDGVLAASATFNSAYNNNDYALGADTDSAGRLWIAGAVQTGGPIEEGGGGGRSYALSLWKYDGSALTQTTAYFGSDGFEVAYDVEVDSADRLWVLGHSSNAANSGGRKVDVVLRQYGSDGATLLKGPARRGAFLTGSENAGAVLLYSTSALYAASMRLNSPGNSDLVFLKYDLTGSTQAEKYWHGAAGDEDEPRSMAFDGSGDVLIGGETGSGFSQKMALWKYSAAGSLLSAQTLSGQREANGLAVDASAVVWAAGESSAPVKLSNLSSLSGAAGLEGDPPPPVSFSFSGAFASGARIAGEGGRAEAGFHVLVDTVTSGGPYVFSLFSSTSSPTPQDGPSLVSIAKYNASAVLLASATLSGNMSGDAAALDSSGNLYIGEKEGDARWITKYGGDLVFVSSVSVSSVSVGNITRMATDGSSLYTADDGGNLDAGAKIIKYSASLVELARSSYTLGTQHVNADALALDGAGNVFVLVSTGEAAGSERHLLKYDASLNLLADATATALLPFGAGLAASGSGVFTAGTNPDGSELYIRKFDSNLKHYGISSTFTNIAGEDVDVRLGPDGNLYAVATSSAIGGGDYLVLRLDVNLALLSSKTFSGGEAAFGLAVQDSTNVYVNGVALSAGDYDAMIARLDLSAGGSGAPSGVGFAALAFDASGAAWAANRRLKEVRKYASLSGTVSELTSATTALTQGLSAPGSLAFDTGGNLWVNTAASTSSPSADLLMRFKGGAAGVEFASSGTINAALLGPLGLAFQPDNGDLWAANAGATLSTQASVVRFARRDTLNSPSFSNVDATTFTLVSALSGVRDLAFDGAKNLWVAAAGAVRMYPNSGGTISSTESVTLIAVSRPASLAFNASGDLFVSSATPGVPGGSLWRFSNQGTAASPSLSTTPVLLDAFAELTDLAFDGTGSGASLWGVHGGQNLLVKLSTSPFSPEQTGAISGTLSYHGVRTGAYSLFFSTSRLKGGSFSGADKLYSLGTASGSFTVGELKAPNTYYVSAFLDSSGNGVEDGFDPSGVHTLSSAPAAAAPVFVTANSTATGINVQLLDVAAATGPLTNNSLQSGSIRLQVWQGPPNDADLSGLLRDLPNPSTSSFAVYFATSSQLHLRAYVDGDNDGKRDSGEDKGVAGPLSNLTSGTTIAASLSISSSPGGSLFAEGLSIASASLARQESDAGLLRLALWSEGGNAQMRSLRVAMGGDAPAAQVTVKLFRDSNSNKTFQPGVDSFLDSAFFGTGLTPLATLEFSTQTLSATTEYFFLGVSYSSVSAGKQVGLKIQDKSAFGLGSGSMAEQSIYPIASDLALVRLTLHAKPSAGGYSAPAAKPNTGGLDSGLSVLNGQKIEVNASGSWGSGAFSAAGPDGVSGQLGGLAGGLSFGSLVGRVGSGDWFQLGSSVTFTSTQTGTLFLAMSDSDYSDNSGSLLVDFTVIPSTALKVWKGLSGLGQGADLDANWLGGKPLPGEKVLFDGSVSTQNCDWNLFGAEVGLMTLATGYTGVVKIVGPSAAVTYNTLTVSSHLVVAGGTLDLGRDTDLDVEGQVRVEGGKLDMGGQGNHLKVGPDGVLVRKGGVFKSAPSGFTTLEAASQYDTFPFKVEDGTVNVNGSAATQFDNVSGVELSSSATLTAFNNVKFFYNAQAFTPSLILHAAAPRSLTLGDLEFGVNVSTNVDASDVVAGSTITLRDSKGTKRGSPNEKDPNGVVVWDPDGGGQGTVTGSLSYGGATTGGSFRIRASTSPRNAFGALAANLSTSAAGAYTFKDLDAPNTWYFFAFRDVSGDLKPNFMEPRGGYGRPGSLRSDPVSVSSGATTGGVNITLEDWGLIEGSVTVNTSQIGPVLVAAVLKSNPSVVEAVEDLSGTGGDYQLFARATDYTVAAFVDVNKNESRENFEAFGSSLGVRVLANSTHSAVSLTISGGSAAPGGTAFVAFAPAHGGVIGSKGVRAMLGLDISVSSDDVAWTGLKVDYAGDVPGSTYAVGLYEDSDEDGTLDASANGGDSLLAGAYVPGGVSTTTLVFSHRQELGPGTTTHYWLTLDLSGQKVRNAGLSLGASTYFTLSQGTVAAQAIYPVASSTAAVYFPVSASQYASAPDEGGVDTGLQVDKGLFVSLVATGTWSPDETSLVGPSGEAESSGEDSVVSAANIGELIARVGSGDWFKAGASTQAKAAQGGKLFLAMNDFPGDYFSNSGELLVDFSLSGSTVGAVAGTVTYRGGVSSGNLRVRANLLDCATCSVVVGTATLSMASGVSGSSATLYAYTLGGLAPGRYSVDAFVEDAPSHAGRIFDPIEVEAGSTATASFALSLGSGSIAGTLAYSGVLDRGSYLIAAATHTDFEHGIVFFGGTSQSSTGSYTLAGLPTPSTYYVVALRDGNFNGETDGPEPFGIYGSTGSIVNLENLFAPIFLDTGAAVTGKDITLKDKGAVSGKIFFSTPIAEADVVVLAGHGPVTSDSYEVENIAFFGGLTLQSGSTLPYSVGLLRPATDYSIFVLVDVDGNEELDAGELFAETLGVSVPEGGFANKDLTVAAPQPPGKVSGFKGVAVSTTQVLWTWLGVAGATTYQLLDSTGGARAILTGSATSYVDTLTPNATSQIVAVRAGNSAGPGSSVTASGVPIASLAEEPDAVSFGGVGESSATLSWGTKANSSLTRYELSRATAASGAPFFIVVAATASSSLADTGLAPETSYYYRAAAINANGERSAFSTLSSTRTLPASAPSLSGLLGYAGRQRGDILLEAYRSSGPFSDKAGSIRLPGASSQIYYLGLSANATYFLRAFVDVDKDASADAGEDAGHYPASTQTASGVFVGGGPVSGKDFELAADTVPPASPSGLSAKVSFKRVDLQWKPPTLNADGGALADLGGYRVQRATSTASPFVTLSTGTVLGSSAATAGAAFSDLAPAGSQAHFYRVSALDYGSNESPVSGVLSVFPSLGGAISGSLSTFTSVTAAAFKVRLSTLPQANALYLRESTLNPFSFDGLEDGTYFLRAFQDRDANNEYDPASEPSGTRGGIDQPFPLRIVNGNTVQAATVTVCDRTPIAPNAQAQGSLAASDCRAVDRNPGNYTDLYTFRVGGGGANSIGVGSEVEIALSAGFANWLFLIGPGGSVIAEGNQSGGAFIRKALSEPGLYILEPTSFSPGVTGPYSLRLSVIGGFGGKIAGTVSYSGSKTGTVYAQLFESPSSNFPVRMQSLASTGAYSIAGLPDGTYYVRAFRDFNGNKVKDGADPFGAFGVSASSPSAIRVTGGVASVSAADVTLSDPAVGRIKGTISREGTQSGTIRVEVGRPACPQCRDLDVIGFATMTAAGDYAVDFLPPATDYAVQAYVDANGNRSIDPLEARASSSAVTVRINSTTTVNILVRDPGTGASGDSTIGGSVLYSGSSTGSVLLAFATDPDFEYIAYTLQQNSTGSFTKSGILGGTSYYIAGFLDVNNNGNPDRHEGEPTGAVGGSFSQQVPTFVARASSATVTLAFQDPPGGVISGTLTYRGSESGALAVQGFIEGVFGDGGFAQTEIARQVGVSTYSFQLRFLAASSAWRVQAFVDSNGNHRPEFGEPFFARSGTLAVSSGPLSSPTTGVGLTIHDAGAGQNVGKLAGSLSYSGSQTGPVVVQVFTTSTLQGFPFLTQNAAGGPAAFTFAFNGVPSGTYYLRAFKDATLNGSFDPAFEASGLIASGVGVSITNDQPFAESLTGTLSDVGGGGGGTKNLSGSLRYAGASITSGTLRVFLFSDAFSESVPVALSTFAFSTSAVSYSFSQLQAGRYHARAFIDPNGNFRPDELEPFGTAAGAGIALEGDVSGVDFELCDRAPLDVSPGASNDSSLSESDCRSSDRPEGSFQKLFTFSGTRGQVVTIMMEATGFYDGYLYLYDPLGRLIAQDDEGAGKGNPAIRNFVLPGDGVYTIGATSFAGGIEGAFKLALSGSSGSLGRISGEIRYEGSQGGEIFAGAFSSSTFKEEFFAAGLRLQKPGPFAFENLAAGASYYIAGFVDVNGNEEPDQGEDAGVFGQDGVPDAIYLRSGEDVGGLIFSIGASTSSSAADVAGTVSYEGEAQGALRVEFWPNARFEGRPVAVRSVETGVGAYDVAVPAPQSYFVRAYLDSDDDFELDDDEPRGVYEPRGEGAELVFVPAAGVPGIDLTLRDPGVEEGTDGIAGAGRASIAPASAQAGALLPGVTVQVLVLKSPIHPGGGVVLGVPPGWPYPQSGDASQPGYVTVGASNPVGAGAGLSLEFPSGAPAVLARVVSSTPLYVGATVQFAYHNAPVPCEGDAHVFFVGSASSGTLRPAELFAGSPEIAAQSGAASAFRFELPYLSLLQGTTSQALGVEAQDACGRSAFLAQSATVTLRGRGFDADQGQFIPEGALRFSTSSGGAFASSLELPFAAGMSSAGFVAVSTKAGAMFIEFFHALGAPTTFYASLSVFPANALSSVSVSTLPFGVGGTSVTIVPNGDAASANQAFINFDLADPELPWQVSIASVPFKDEEERELLWQSWGVGQPARGQIAWDGRYSPWLENGARVPSGSYYARVEVGSGIRDDSLRIDVIAPRLLGRVFDSGTLPATPIAGVHVFGFGPNGSTRVQSDERGEFNLPGLVAGGYVLSFQKPAYLVGSARVTLTTATTISTFTALTPRTISVSTSNGSLDVLMKRAPVLVAIPSVAAADAPGETLRGSIVVQHPSGALVLPLRLSAGTTTFDDGGQWDPSLGRYVTHTAFRFDLPLIATYTIRAELPGFDVIVSSPHFMESGLKEVALPAFSRRRVISGKVALPSGFNTDGVLVSVNAVPLSTTTAARESFDAVPIPAGLATGTYRLAGLEAGSYRLVANAAGLTAVSIPSVTLAAVDISTDFPPFSDPSVANLITGTVAVAANTGGFPALGPGEGQLRVVINAWSPGSLNFGRVEVGVATSAAAGVCGALGLGDPCSFSTFTLRGLEAGREYQIYASLLHKASLQFESPGGFPKRVLISSVTGVGNLAFRFEAASATVRGTVLLPEGSTDFAQVQLFGKTVASLKPERVGGSFEVLTATAELPGFACTANAQAPSAGGFCPAGNSSATFRVEGLSTETLELTFHYKRTGQIHQGRVSLVSGSTTTLTADLRPGTFSVSGAILNQVAHPLFNTNARILDNAPHVPLRDERGRAAAVDGALAVLSTASLARVQLARYNFGVSPSTSFAAATSRVGYLHRGGTFSVVNVPAGLYVLRTEDLRSCATCEVLVPAQSRLVRVTTYSIAGADMALGDGFLVSGLLRLDESIRDARTLRVSLFNGRQELSRSTMVALGSAGTGALANSVAYAFANVPPGDFYSLSVEDAAEVPRYVSAPIKFPNPALAPKGLQSDLPGQNALLQRAAYFIGRLKDAEAGELIGAGNAFRLTPNFRIKAVANPWVEGGFALAASSVAGRPILADGTFRVGPLLPKLSYDVRFEQESWNLAYLAQGSQNYTPMVLSGLFAQAGEFKDLGTVGLSQGQSLRGTVVDAASTSTVLGNIRLVARPSFARKEFAGLEVETFTDAQGAFSLWVSTALSNQYDVTVAPRGGNQASSGKVYQQLDLVNVSVSTAPLALRLRELLGSVTGQIATADGEPLSYPFGERRGLPIAAVFLQKAGVVPVKNPMGDIEDATDESGVFSLNGLSTGTYTLRAASLGYAVAAATVSVSTSAFCVYTGTQTGACLSRLSLERGGTLRGRILTPAGGAPSIDEVAGVAAANRGFTEFVLGTVETDKLARTISGYHISGFKPGLSYDVVLMPKDNAELVFPAEGTGVGFTASESTTTKTLNLTYLSPKPQCSGQSKLVRGGLGNRQFLIKVACSQPLRNTLSSDNDLDQILSVSSATSSGLALTSPNGTGGFVAGSKKFSDDRREITALYNTGTNEKRYSLKLAALSSKTDPTTGDPFRIEKVFDFFTGLRSVRAHILYNAQGGAMRLEPSQEDEEAGREERFRVDVPPGSFLTDGEFAAGLGAGATTQVSVEVRKAENADDAAAQAAAAYGFVPESVRALAEPDAYPRNVASALAAYRTQAVNSAALQAVSQFYDIFLPLGIRSQLGKRVDVTLPYDIPASSVTISEDALNVWYYNSSTGKFELEAKDRRQDKTNKTLTVSVGHFSTFIVLASTPVISSSEPFSGSEIEAFNFPNPSDCIQHTKTLNNLLFRGGTQISFDGTMVRYSLPPGGAEELTLKIYNVAGELVRELGQGALRGGFTYYTPWDCRNQGGNTVASGVYIGQIKWGGRNKFFKMAIIKGSGL